MRNTVQCPVQCLTERGAHHFFGYYDKCVWDVSGRYVLAGEVDFLDHNPAADEPLRLGIIDLENDNSFRFMTTTNAWNWQQGSMLRWLPGRDDTFVFNDRENDCFKSVTCNIRTMERNVLGDALYDITEDGKWGVSLNFARITDCRPGYGYPGVQDPFKDELWPEQDGISVINLGNGGKRMIVNAKDVAEVGTILPDQKARVWFNHLKFNPSGNRLLFFHRWAKEACPGHLGFESRVLTVNRDGSNLSCLIEGCGASHYDWLDDENLLIFLYHPDGDGYYIINDNSGEMRQVGAEYFSTDGHCVYRPQKDWFLTDTYPEGENREQKMMLFHPGNELCVDIAAFSAMSVSDPSTRCDLHSRWDRTGTNICFDSTHEGSRQMYMLDVSKIVNQGGI